MATLSSIALRLARKITPVRQGTATTSTITSLTDSYMRGMGDFTDGVLWFLSGTHDGKMREISSNPKDKFNFTTPLASAPCAAQVETATVVGTVTGDGNATVIVTAAGMPGTPKTVSVAVLNEDTAGAVGGKIRTALAADTDISSFFAVSGSGANVVLTRLLAVANDATLNISIANGTCTGLTAAPTSANTTAGVLGNYAAADKKVRRDLLLAAVNEALRQVKSRLTEDDSTLTVDSEVDEYDLPDDTDVLLKVEIATSDEEPYGYYEDRHWVQDLINNQLRFAAFYAPQVDSRKIRLTYRVVHSDETDEAADLEITPEEEEGAYWRALIELISSLISLRPEGSDGKRLADLFQEAQVEWGRWKSKNITQQRACKLADW